MAGGKATESDWNLISSEEATPLKLEQPNTTVVLSEDETAWFRSAHKKAATRAAAVNARATSATSEAKGRLHRTA
jgi:hypothetical protein